MPIKLASHGDERGSADSDDHAEESHSTGLNPERQQPLVCCVTLTKDRPQMLQRAIACYQSQTYKRRSLFILDVGEGSAEVYHRAGMIAAPTFYYQYAKEYAHRSVGSLRNLANSYARSLGADILIHVDDDDWSHPERIAEQVALLQASGKECVGYREMLFWNSTEGQFCGAWLYRNGNPRYALGTSLCYWRSVSERRPFEDKAYGEDTAWLLGVDSLGVSTIPGACTEESPRMIASIHGGNTSPAYRAELMRASEKQNGEWKRAPQWDGYCRRTMEAHGEA